MCGIGGILRVTPPGEAAAAMARDPREAIPEAWLDIIDESIKHRGPDGAGRFRDRAVRPDGSVVDVALVHRRLSIIDHEGGHQPMVSLGKGWGVVTSAKTLALGQGLGLYEPGGVEWLGRARSTSEGLVSQGVSNPSLARRARQEDEGEDVAHPDLVAVIFNGCIYNHRELRKELEAKGHEFSTDHCDTEVLVHGWREWQEGLYLRVVGMFAFAVWDRRTATVFLARDRFGEKPLYYRTNGQAHAFSGCIPALTIDLTGSPRVRHSVVMNEGVIPWIRTGFSDYPDFLLNDIYLVWDETWWLPDLPSRPRFEQNQPACHVDPFHPLSSGTTSVSPVGPRRLPSHASSASQSAFRSPEDVASAIESVVADRLDADVPVGCFLSGGVDSSLVARAARMHAGKLTTICVRMASAGYDESLHAQRVAEIIGSDHVVLDVGGSPAEDLLRLIPMIGLPFGDSSLLPTHWVSTAARKHVRVALSGDGGDELFAGYDRYRAADWFRRWRPLLAAIPRSVLPRRSPKSRTDKLARLVTAARHARYLDLVSIFQTPDHRRVVHWEGLVWEPRLKKVDAAGARLWDIKNYLPNDLLLKVDSASMAVALEVRCPFLDPAFADRALSTPLPVLMLGGERKGLLRAVARLHFPPDIVDRTKMGFAIPIGEWFRTDYGGMRQLLYDHLEGHEPFGPDQVGLNSMINMAFVRKMLKQHDDAGMDSLWPWKGRDHSQRLYMLLVLSIWAKWVGGLRGAA